MPCAPSAVIAFAKASSAARRVASFLLITIAATRAPPALSGSAAGFRHVELNAVAAQPPTAPVATMAATTARKPPIAYLPGSATLTKNSVPRTPMMLVGVRTRIASGDCLTMRPETTPSVPRFRLASKRPACVVLSKL